MIDQQLRDKKTRPSLTPWVCGKKLRGSVTTKHVKTSKGLSDRNVHPVVYLFMTLQGEIKNIKISSANGGEAVFSDFIYIYFLFRLKYHLISQAYDRKT